MFKRFLSPLLFIMLWSFHAVTFAAATKASVSVSLTAPTGSAAEAGRNSFKSMLFSPCNNASGDASGASNQLKDQLSVKLTGINPQASSGKSNYDLFFFFVNLGAKGDTFPASVANAQFYVVRRYQSLENGINGSESNQLDAPEVKLRANMADLRRADVLLRRSDFKTATFEEAILGDSISLEDFNLPFGTWLAVAILADRNDSSFSFSNPATWPAWDAVPILLGSPWQTVPAKTCTKAAVTLKPISLVQEYKQGNINNTQSSLDLAISGNGLFVFANEVNIPETLTPAETIMPSAFSRNGAFQLDFKGYIINNQGQYLLGYPAKGTTVAEGFNTGVLRPLYIDTSLGTPAATSHIVMQVNLDAFQLSPQASFDFFDRTNPKTFNASTSISIYDSQGKAHVASTYFVKSPDTPNTWSAYFFADDFGITPGDPATVADPLYPPAKGGNSGDPIPITFNYSGLLETVNGQAPGITNLSTGDIDLSAIDPWSLVNPLNVTLDFRGSTHYSMAYTVSNLQQNGLPAGVLSGIEIDSRGILFSRYSNGSSKPLSQVALAGFQTNQDLYELSNGQWAINSGSASPIYGAGNSAGFGDIQSSALEQPNTFTIKVIN